jgi:hypothetical protein
MLTRQLYRRPYVELSRYCSPFDASSSGQNKRRSGVIAQFVQSESVPKCRTTGSWFPMVRPRRVQ